MTTHLASPFPQVQTERTISQLIRLDDAPFILSLVNTAGWLRFIGNRHIHDLEGAAQYLKNGFLKSYQEHRFGYYVIRLKDSERPIGICGFLQKPFLDNPDFGFALLPEYVGHGYALESGRAVLAYGVSAYQFKVVDAVTNVENVRSAALLEKLGFRLCGRVEGVQSDQELMLYRFKLGGLDE